MPAHEPIDKDRNLEMLVLVVDKKTWNQHIPDGHAQIKFRWRGGSRTWEIEGVQEPQSRLLDLKHNWQVYDKGLPKGQGDAILRLLDWIQALTSNV